MEISILLIKRRLIFLLSYLKEIIFSYVMIISFDDNLCFKKNLPDQFQDNFNVCSRLFQTNFYLYSNLAITFLKGLWKCLFKWVFVSTIINQFHHPLFEELIYVLLYEYPEHCELISLIKQLNNHHDWISQTYSFQKYITIACY